jgi:hypothetical protein
MAHRNIAEPSPSTALARPALKSTVAGYPWALALRGTRGGRRPLQMM